MRWVIPAFLGLLLVAVVMFCVRMGVFLPVTLEEKTWPALSLVWKTHVGPYHEILPDLQEVEAWIKANGETCAESFGEFLDDPNVVEHDRLRSHVGCIVRKRPEAALPAGYEFGELPERAVVVATYGGSPALGPYKVYGKAQAHILNSGLQASAPPLEVYRVTTGQGLETFYVFPVKKAVSP